MQDTWQWPKSRRYYISIEFEASRSPSEFVAPVEAFCRRNRFKLLEAGTNRILANRGSLWGNCNSFNIQKIICDAEFEMIDGRVKVALRPDGIMQQMTGWNFASYQLELLELKGDILGIQRPTWLRQFRF
jgi:hypothetical protein